MFKDTVKELPTCKHCESLLHPDFDGETITFSCPYECQWVGEYIEKQPCELSRQDIEFLSNIGIPFNSIWSEFDY